MNAAFLFCIALPPPAPRALIFMRPDRPRAGVAADAGIAARIQRMHRHAMLARVLLNLRGSPSSQRVDLYRDRVQLHFGGFGAGFGLVAAYAGGPGAQGREFAFERPDFANVAA